MTRKNRSLDEPRIESMSRRQCVDYGLRFAKQKSLYEYSDEPLLAAEYASKLLQIKARLAVLDATGS
jgi:hypothetical protein